MRQQMERAGPVEKDSGASDEPVRLDVRARLQVSQTDSKESHHSRV